MIHLLLHVLFPALVALAISRKRFLPIFLLLMAGMLVDADHLLANPIYDPSRCSIGFHPLHTWPAVLGYGVLLCFSPTRLLAVGLLIHMGLDTGDCLLMPGGSEQLGNFFRRLW